MHFERGSMIRIAFSLDEENRPMKIFLDVCLFIYSFDRFVEQVVQLEKFFFSSDHFYFLYRSAKWSNV